MRASVVLAAALVMVVPGCLQLEEAPPASGSKMISVGGPEMPGVVLDINVSWEGNQFLLRAKATNRGTQTFRISSICDSPFGTQIRAADGDAIWPGPVVICDAYGRKDFGPAASEAFEERWNGTKVDANGNYAGAAAQGAYVWRVTFWGERPEGARRTVTADIDIRVH